MLSEYEAVKLAKDARRELYPSLPGVWAAGIGTVILIVAAVLSEAPVPASDVQATPPRLSPAIAHSRQVYEERRARFEQARGGGAQELADKQADAARTEGSKSLAR